MRIFVAALFLLASTLAAFPQSGVYGPSSSGGVYSPRMVQAKKKVETCQSILTRCLAQCRRLSRPDRPECVEVCQGDDTWCHICGPMC